ncbi:hypothetical protein FQR65_LT19408 [Abscondita terminalis]|nr:hypothetical protein FQR65_LT19408 [Abscondita terminalis]
MDSNHRMPESESGALPLGDGAVKPVVAGSLALRELGCTTSLVQTNLLTFHFTGITGHEAGLTQFGLQGLVIFDQCAGNAQTNGTGLAGGAAARGGSDDIEIFSGLGQFQRLTHDHAGGLATKKLIQRTAIDGDVAGALAQKHASGGRLATASALVASDGNLFGVDDHQVITGVNVGGINGLVLATQAAGQFGGQAAQRFAGGVYEIPVALDGLGLGGEGLHDGLIRLVGRIAPGNPDGTLPRVVKGGTKEAGLYRQADLRRKPPSWTARGPGWQGFGQEGESHAPVFGTRPYPCVPSACTPPWIGFWLKPSVRWKPCWAPPPHADERRHAAGLMRINHVGEVCAQGLYFGQAAVARDDHTRAHLLEAAQEETDHLAWCADRLRELDSRPSVFNPLWYAGSYALGALAGLRGDGWSLGFVVETEHQVEAHLDEHLLHLPVADLRSREILQVMKADEARHAHQAEQAGARVLPAPIPHLMAAASRVMKYVAYRI